LCISKDNAQPKKPQTTTIQIKVSDSIQKGVYSNAASVTVNAHEVILDFGYVLPNVQPTTIDVVSRINMTHHSAESFISTFQNALLDHRNKTKESDKR